MNLKMVEAEQLVRWLNDSGETEAAQLSKGCSLNWIWVSLLSELGGDRDWDLWDVNIEAPAPTLRRLRRHDAAIGNTIEAALRELAEASGSASVRDVRWVPKQAPASVPPQISEVTRREIIDRLVHLAWAGRLREDEFLSRLWDLHALPSNDRRFETAAGDIWQHRINNDDGDPDWIFYDGRFNLLHGPDEDFLRFLSETVHPVVRPDTKEALELVGFYNQELKADGWEIVRSADISGRPVFSAHKTAQQSEIFPEPTGWPRVDRQIGEVRLRLREASNEEQFQSVGHLCRETLISAAQAAYDPSRHPPVDGVAPSPTDAKRMLEAFLAVELAGGDHAAARKHAKAAFDLANELQHKRTARFRDAALCAEAAYSVIRIVAIVSGRRERTELE